MQNIGTAIWVDMGQLIKYQSLISTSDIWNHWMRGIQSEHRVCT